MFKRTCLMLSMSLLAACTGQTQIAAPQAAPGLTRPFLGQVSMSQPSHVQASPGRVEVSTSVMETIQDELIVKYRDGFRTQQLNGATVLDRFETSQESTQLHRLPQNLSLDEAVRRYEADPGVEFVMPNVRFQVQMNVLQKAKNFFSGGRAQIQPSDASPEPSPEPSSAPSSSPSPELPTPEATPVQTTGADPLRGDQWYLDQLDMEAVWANYGTGDAGITVAVLDTGVDYDHPDLKGRIIKGPDYIDRDYDPKDLHGHGTHVAGVIAAGLNNGVGISGLAPNTQILAVRVLDERGSGSLFNIAKGIAYSANKGAKVINLSLGSPPGGSIMKTLANFLARYASYKGALIIAAAGNSSGDIGYPAAASRFMAVGATNDKKYLASFSNRGKELDVVAPGVQIMSTFPTYEVTANDYGLPHDYASLNGTSMATPMVSALAALIWSQNPYLEPEEVRQKLESTAVDLGAIGVDDMFGQGLINPAQAMLNAPVQAVDGN